MTCKHDDRSVKSVTTAVERLQGDHEPKKRTKTKKVLTEVSQALRADKITEELDGYVKILSWYLDSFTVCVGSHVIRSRTSH